MTTVRDFQSPERVYTNLSVQSDPAQTEALQRGTANTTGRRASVVSRSESVNSIITKRRIGRSNTIKTYHDPDRPNWQPGAEPGLDTTKEEGDDEPRLTNLREECDIHITDYSEEHIFTQKAVNATLKEALNEPRPDDMPCRWISVNGLSWDVIKLLANKYGLHRLAVEDLLNIRSRTKVDWYSDHAVAILTLQKLVRICTHDDEDEDCNCGHGDGPAAARIDHGSSSGRRPWWNPFKSNLSEQDNVLPKYQPGDDTTTNMVKAHDAPSDAAPVKYIRTLHRYESSHNPQYTAFMEKHSVLADENLVVSVEQVAIFLMADNTVISFFEHSGPDVEGPIFTRLNSLETMLRRSCDASLLVQAILDTVVDLALPVRDVYNKVRREMQVDVLTNPDIDTSKSLYIFSEEIDMLQNLFRPLVYLINSLRDHQTEPLHSMLQQQASAPPYSPNSNNPTSSHMQQRRPPNPRTQTSTSVVISPLCHTYLGDVLDHCVTHLQALEQMDASATNLSSLIFNTVGAKTNNFMMILALVTVFFSPLTFISGYFGMNFDAFDAIHDHSDAFFWAVALPSVAVFMVAVSGSVMWGMLRSWYVKSSIRRLRGLHNRQRAAGFGTLDGAADGMGRGKHRGLIRVHKR